MAKASKEKRRQKVIEVLNQARAMELHAIHQYMNQHYNLDDMDYGELAAKIKLIAIDEMRHAEMFAERIKELGGEPVTGFDQKVVKGQEVEKIYPFDSGLEDDTIDVYNQFLLICRDNGDIKKLGGTYLAKIAGTPSSTGLGPSGFVVSGSGE
jgi:bacterioferritin